jgi:hypothetical protein
VERANGVIGDTLRAAGPTRANGRKDNWDRQLPLAVLAINNAASESTLGDGLTGTPFFIDRGAHPRLPLTTPAPAASSPSPAGGPAARVGRGAGARPGRWAQKMSARGRGAGRCLAA